jgi:hypothetical protein
MEEIKETLSKLEDYEVLEIFKNDINERFSNNQYVYGFDPDRQTDALIINLKFLLDSL